MVEEVSCADFGIAGGEVRGIYLSDFGVDEGGLPRHGFEHGVGAEGVEVCACVGEWEPGSNALEGERG